MLFQVFSIIWDKKEKHTGTIFRESLTPYNTVDLILQEIIKQYSKVKLSSYPGDIWIQIIKLVYKTHDIKEKERLLYTAIHLETLPWYNCRTQSLIFQLLEVIRTKKHFKLDIEIFYGKSEFCVFLMDARDFPVLEVNFYPVGIDRSNNSKDNMFLNPANYKRNVSALLNIIDQEPGPDYTVWEQRLDNHLKTTKLLNQVNKNIEVINIDEPTDILAASIYEAQINVPGTEIMEESVKISRKIEDKRVSTQSEDPYHSEDVDRSRSPSTLKERSRSPSIERSISGHSESETGIDDSELNKVNQNEIEVKNHGEVKKQVNHSENSECETIIDDSEQNKGNQNEIEVKNHSEVRKQIEHSEHENYSVNEGNGEMEWSRGLIYSCTLCNIKMGHRERFWGHVKNVHSTDSNHFQQFKVSKKTYTCEICDLPILHEKLMLKHHMRDFHMMSLSEYSEFSISKGSKSTVIEKKREEGEKIEQKETNTDITDGDTSECLTIRIDDKELNELEAIPKLVKPAFSDISSEEMETYNQEEKKKKKRKIKKISYEGTKRRKGDSTSEEEEDEKNNEEIKEKTKFRDRKQFQEVENPKRDKGEKKEKTIQKKEKIGRKSPSVLCVGGLSRRQDYWGPFHHDQRYRDPYYNEQYRQPVPNYYMGETRTIRVLPDEPPYQNYEREGRNFRFY